MFFTSWTLQTVPVLCAKLFVFALELWSGTLVLGALGDEDDFLLLLVWRPRPLIGRHLKKRKYGFMAFCGTKFLHDIKFSISCKHITWWLVERTSTSYEKPYRRTHTHVCINLVLKSTFTKLFKVLHTFSTWGPEGRWPPLGAAIWRYL